MFTRTRFRRVFFSSTDRFCTVFSPILLSFRCENSVKNQPLCQSRHTWRSLCVKSPVGSEVVMGGDVLPPPLPIQHTHTELVYSVLVRRGVVLCDRPAVSWPTGTNAGDCHTVSALLFHHDSGTIQTAATSATLLIVKR